MATLDAQLYLRTIEENRKSDVFNDRVAVRTSNTEHRYRKPLTGPVTIGPVTDFLFIQHRSTFRLILDVNGVSITTKVTGVFMSAAAYDNVVLDIDPDINKQDVIYVYWT